jgi:hypothetical protein
MSDVGVIAVSAGIYLTNVWFWAWALQRRIEVSRTLDDPRIAQQERLRQFWGNYISYFAGMAITPLVGASFLFEIGKTTSVRSAMLGSYVLACLGGSALVALLINASHRLRRIRANEQDRSL